MVFVSVLVVLGKLPFSLTACVVEVVPESKWEVEEIIDQVTNAHNTMARKDGYSSNQHVLGAEVRVPSMLTCGGRDEAAVQHLLLASLRT